MMCCGYCFGHKFMVSHVDVHSSETGNCSFCPTHSIPLVSPADLIDQFSPVFDLYRKEEAGGESLIALLRRDWSIFNGVEDERAMRLLRHVVDDSTWDFGGYKPIKGGVDQGGDVWDDFKAELKHDNRFFPESFPDKNMLANLLSYLSTAPDSDLEYLYRARINRDVSQQYSVDKMGAPPPEKASGGRANPFGIAYLYTASNTSTAISELRPHNGDEVTVAEFQVVSALKLIDLRNPRVTASPFRYVDEELDNIHAGIGLLVKLGEELTKPVSKNKASLEYLSSQYLCEFIKSQGYGGVIYCSALSGGDNYAIFDESNLKGIKTRRHMISDLAFAYEENGEELLAEESEAVVTVQAVGSVLWFSDMKGYGFIKGDDGKNYFVHHTSIVSSCSGKKTLKQGKKVRFTMSKNSKGYAAEDVSLHCLGHV
jgi:cold shock CspA family protein